MSERTVFVGDACYDEKDLIEIIENEETLSHRVLKLESTLKALQAECGYASPWWIVIEKTLNPSNPVLVGEDT